MKNLILALLLVNILYFMWGMFVEPARQPGVAILDESELGPALSVSGSAEDDALGGVGAVLGSSAFSELAAVVGRSCVTIGPFRERDDADEAVSEYQSAGMRTALRSTMGEVFVGHSVTVQNIESWDQGTAMRDRLHDVGLGDAYLVGNEEEGIAISLGIFGNAENAEKVELQAESVGLDVDISPMMRDSQVHFVDIGLPPGRGAGGIVEKYGQDRVLLRDQATCPTTR